MLFPMKKLQAGMEFCTDCIKSALVVRKGKNFSIRQLSDVKIPAQALKPSFKKQNIINEEFFHDSLKKVCHGIKLKTIGVCLPDACIKVSIKTFRAIPDNPEKLDAMILWNMSNSLGFPEKDLRISWEKMGKNSKEEHVFLTALSLESVVAEYESAIKKMGIKPVMILPSGLSQFNFYSPAFPEKGNIAYLGLFNDFLNIFVFSDCVPVFHKMVRKGLLSGYNETAIEDIDLLLQYLKSETPDFVIEKIYVASHIKSEGMLEDLLQDLPDSDLTLLNEEKLMGFDKRFKLNPENNPLPFYTSVLGAARYF